MAKEEYYAAIWRRAAAFLIDIIIVFLIMYVLLWFNFFEDVILSTIYLILIFSIPLIYFIIFEANGQTLGKKLLRIEIITIEGKKPGVWRSFLRNIFRIADALPFFYILGIILMLSTKRKQRLGDIIAGTIVVKA